MSGTSESIKNRKIIVLGSTGSVGTQALDVAVHHGIKVVGISGSRSVGKLEEQIRTFRPEYCAVADEKAASDLKTRVADTECRIIAGKDSSSELAAIDGADTVINSVTTGDIFNSSESCLIIGRFLFPLNRGSHFLCFISAPNFPRPCRTHYHHSKRVLSRILFPRLSFQAGGSYI